MKTKKSLGQKIRRLREERGWTQEELAHRLRTAGSTVSRWETGKQIPHPMALSALEQVFGVNLGKEVNGE